VSTVAGINFHTKVRPAMTRYCAPCVLELASQQWGIKLPGGHVVATGTGAERTRADTAWENNDPRGKGGCTAVVRESYVTPWRDADQADLDEGGPGEGTQTLDMISVLTHYRDLAIRLGAAPEDMTTGRDAHLCTVGAAHHPDPSLDANDTPTDWDSAACAATVPTPVLNLVGGPARPAEPAEGQYAPIG
jgi:hypothetical protein